MSSATDGNKGFVELPENVTSQDVEVDGNKSNTIPVGHRNASGNPNDHMTSKNHKTKVLENRQGGNTEPTNAPPPDESPTLDPNTETATIDDIPISEFHPTWISRTVFNVDTHTDYFMGEAVQHVDPQIKGNAGETECDVNDIGSILWENIRHAGSEKHKADSEIGGILEDTVQSIDSEIGGTVQDALGIIQKPSPLCLADLSNKNTLKANINNALSDIPESTANVVESDEVWISESLTVNGKRGMEPEDRVADMTVDHTTENNSDAGLIISSFPHAPIRIPSETSKEVTHTMYRCDTSNELWVDAWDEWRYLPASCSSMTSTDSTRTSKAEAESGSSELLTVESWSSSDSWASALSDWIQCVSVVPEDYNTTRTPASQHQFSMSEEKSTGLESDLESGGKMLIRPPGDQPVLQRVEKESSLYGKSDVTQGLAEDPEAETRLGLQEAENDSENDCTDGTLETKCVSKDNNALREVTEDAAFEGDGERHHGALRFPCYPVTPESEVRRLQRCETERGTKEADGPGAGEVDFMPLTPIAIGTSTLRLKEDPDGSRTSLKPSLAGTGEDIRPRGKAAKGSSDEQDYKAGGQDSSLAPCEELDYKTQTGDVITEVRTPIFPAAERLMICEEKHVAYVTLDLDDVLSFKKHNRPAVRQGSEMPRKTPKGSSENKPRWNKHKDKTSNSHQQKRENLRPEDAEDESGGAKEVTATVIETLAVKEKEKVGARSQGKKKKKHEAAKAQNEPLLEVENGTKPKNTKPKNEAAAKQPSAMRERLAKYEGAGATGKEKTCDAKPKPSTETSSASPAAALDDDIIKRRRVSGDKPGAVAVRMRPQLPAIFQQRKKEDAVTQTGPTPKGVPRVVAEIEAAPVADDPLSILLWCRFSNVSGDSSVMWLKEGATLHEENRKAGDDARVSLSLLKACSKDLGFYRCTLISDHGAMSTSDYHLTSEVLMELVIPDHDTPAERKAVEGQEEDVSCAPLLFKEDILTQQYFGERQRTSIVTEKDHFGEGMHRKAFRTMVRSGAASLFGPGHTCVLKVHSSIGYGTQNDDEVVQKNYNLAVEECYVQNTAREYIKAYTDVAKSAESFGEVPEIIPIVLVHRPSNAVPYATLEEELIGDFVKYSVKDGKEINLMRRDSEAGQKCCAFQHWVYAQTDGNLLVTDMQGVGMKLTDVGIATCKKGYKGFKGNCSTSFIDQFKALHQCNRFCELLGLTSLQPKPKRTAPPNPKAQPAARKKPFGPNVKGKS